MPQFFIHSADIQNSVCVITGSDCGHLKRSRRITSGATIHVRDENGVRYRALVVSVTEDGITLEVSLRAPGPEMRHCLVLCAGILKGSKFDFVIQKSVEIGVSEIIPVITERTISRPAGRGDAKTGRWKRVAAEAAKQCMAGRAPIVHDICRFSDVIDYHADLKLIAHTAEASLIHGLASGGKRVMVLVGPEGGFSPEEYRKAVEKGWRGVSAGPTQMRAETAAIVIPSIILHELVRNGT